EVSRSFSSDQATDGERQMFQGALIASLRSVSRELNDVADELRNSQGTIPKDHLSQQSDAADEGRTISKRLAELAQKPPAEITPEFVSELFKLQINLEQA